MFKKIISNLSYSPALVWQLGSYAKTIRKEEITRRLGLAFVILTLIVQSLVIFQPPEPANASNPNDMIKGGIGSSLSNLLSSYDSNSNHLKDILAYIGITKDELSKTYFTSWNNDNKITWGLLPHFSYKQGERQYNITDSNGQQITTVYARPLKLYDNINNKSQGWVGNSTKLGWFAIMQNNGNLVTDKLIRLSAKTCTNNESLLASDLLCTPNVIRSTTATNISQGFLDASTMPAVASDQISYTISVENTGSNNTSVSLSDNLYDILEYSTLIDTGGGILDDSSKVLSWPDIALNSKSKQTRTFVIKMADNIPATANGSSNPTSFDCIIANTFGNSININVDCPIQKTAEKIINSMPTINSFINITFACILILITGYLYARSRQIKKEVRIIRKDTSTGTI